MGKVRFGRLHYRSPFSTNIVMLSTLLTIGQAFCSYSEWNQQCQDQACWLKQVLGPCLVLVLMLAGTLSILNYFFSVFSHSRNLENRPPLLPFIYYPLHHSLIISFNAISSQLLTALLHNPKVKKHTMLGDISCFHSCNNIQNSHISHSVLHNMRS